MSVSPAQLRSLLRLVHVVAAVVLGVAAYVPVIPAETARLLIATVVMPLLALSGVAMWKQARLRRLLNRRSAPGRAGGR